jgi:uncharacterized membrane protein YjjB (DUF3815 family)
MYIYDRGDVVSAMGATVVGILGSMYGHISKGDALPSMMPGILVLLPVRATFSHSSVDQSAHIVFRLVFLLLAA